MGKRRLSISGIFYLLLVPVIAFASPQTVAINEAVNWLDHK